MKISLRYGRGGLDLNVPDSNLLAVLRMPESDPLAKPEAAVRTSLASPIGCASLSEMAKGKRNACIAICDITRPVPNALLLPPILDALEAGGIKREYVLILIATGLHRPNEGEELVALVGEEIASTQRVENHFARDAEAHVELGVTTTGVPVKVDRRFVEADLRIVTGFIEPHFMAGYSGGRKLVCPGLAAAETINAFHAPGILSDPHSGEGLIKENPVHGTALEAARMAKVDFSVCVSLDEARRVTGVFSGDVDASHQTGCSFVANHVSVAPPDLADIVVTTCGGAPLDATFYQSVKGVTAALPAVKPGGTILLASECAEGLGSEEFANLLSQWPDPKAFEAALLRGEIACIDQWQYQKLCQALSKANVELISKDLSPQARAIVPISCHEDIQTALDAAIMRHGADARVTVIPSGPYVLVSKLNG